MTQILIERIAALLSRQDTGLKPAQIARELKVHPEAVARALASAQRAGVLLQEDSKGRIKRYDPQHH